MNQVLAAGARKGSSCWFPLGTGNERIIRFVDDRAVILNSRCVNNVLLPDQVTGSAAVPRYCPG